jgi:hypothetical protein
MSDSGQVLENVDGRTNHARWSSEMFVNGLTPAHAVGLSNHHFAK